MKKRSRVVVLEECDIPAFRAESAPTQTLPIYVGWGLLCVLLRVRRELLSPFNDTEKPKYTEIYGFILLLS